MHLIHLKFPLCLDKASDSRPLLRDSIVYDVLSPCCLILKLANSAKVRWKCLALIELLHDVRCVSSWYISVSHKDDWFAIIYHSHSSVFLPSQHFEFMSWPSNNGNSDKRYILTGPLFTLNFRGFSGLNWIKLLDYQCHILLAPKVLLEDLWPIYDNQPIHPSTHKASLII